jgi:nitroreductase
MTHEIIKHKSEIINSLISWIKKEHPLRTSEYHKCYRDLEMIIDAIVLDLTNNTITETQYIVNKFWSRGEPMLQDYKVELQVYDILLPKIQNLVNKSKVTDYNIQLTHLIENIIKPTIINGPEYEKNTWDYLCDRRIATFNWTKQIPDTNIIKKIVHSIHEFTPSKQCRVRYNIDVIPNYQNEELKNIIYAGTHADNPKLPNSRYNPQVLAPWLLSFSVRWEGNTEKRDVLYYEKEAWLDIGIAIQHTSLASVALGLDVGFCSCIQNQDEMKLLLNGRKPVMYLCLGYRNNNVMYHCPVQNELIHIPKKNYDTKPLIEEYVFYK